MLHNMAVSNVINDIVVLQQMLSGPSFSVLLDHVVTTSPNNFLVLAPQLQSKRKRERNKEMRSQKEEPPAKLISGPTAVHFGGGGFVCL